MPGAITSNAEVTKVSRNGFWLLVDGQEHFLSFNDFPWFEKAPVEAIRAVARPRPHHLRWPELDVDLTLASIEHPEKFPLVAKSVQGSEP